MYGFEEGWHFHACIVLYIRSIELVDGVIFLNALNGR